MSAFELAVSRGDCNGQVDAEKLAQRSSVAAWMLSSGSECAWCHLNLPDCLPCNLLPLLNLFTGLRLVAGRFDVLVLRQGCSIA